MTTENERIREVYRGYEQDASRRWDPGSPGNIALADERRRVARQLLTAHGAWPLGPRTALEIGCGGGRVMLDLHAAGASVDAIVGLDLIASRIAASDLAGVSPFVVGDGARLPFDDSRFRVVLAFTVFSSVLDRGTSEAIAREVDRVLAPGGIALIYDFRYPSPRNPNTIRVTPADIARLFPNYDMDVRTLSFVPPLARKLGRAAPVLYRPLAAVPFLRTHVMAAARKPG